MAGHDRRSDEGMHTRNAQRPRPKDRLAQSQGAGLSKTEGSLPMKDGRGERRRKQSICADLRWSSVAQLQEVGLELAYV